MAGRVWVDEADAETARLEVGLVQPVFLGWFGLLGSLTQCDLSLERQRMPDGVWVNTKQALLIQCRKLTAICATELRKYRAGLGGWTAKPCHGAARPAKESRQVHQACATVSP